MVRTIHTSVPSVALFQQFTSDLINLKQQALAPEPSESTTLDLQPESEGGPAVLVSRANVIWNKVLVLLDQQTLAAMRIAGPGGLEFHREAIYVMAVLADEVFVHSEWEGREYWLNHLLEARLFQTHAAGEIFFRRLEALLRREDEAAAELAIVYLMALSLGFRGKYWGAAHEPILDVYSASRSGDRTACRTSFSCRLPQYDSTGRADSYAFPATMALGMRRRPDDLVGISTVALVGSHARFERETLPSQFLVRGDHLGCNGNGQVGAKLVT
jgi:hypothetical protein